jgi:uncharacterized protein DUF1194
MRFVSTRLFLCMAMICALPVVVQAKKQQIDVALVLAVDVSSSVNWSEFSLQMNGISTAFRDDSVWQAVMDGEHQKISVALLQWSGVNDQSLSIGWTLISSRQDLLDIADRADHLGRAFPYGGTGLAAALRVSFSLFNLHPFQTNRRVIDISGDGRASVGFKPEETRDYILSRNITINGLPILNEDKDLDNYYQTSVVGGSGAFTEIADDYSDFSRALTRKLAREIRGPWIGAEGRSLIEIF